MRAPELIRELGGRGPRSLGDAELTATEPWVARGLVDHWPMVLAARRSDDDADRYLRHWYRESPVLAMLGGPEMRGRFFYNGDFTGFNFRLVKTRLDTVLDELARHRDDAQPPTIYVGSTTIDTCLPGLREENDLDFGARDPLASIWVGNHTRIAAHHDLPDNVACVVAGRRRFTLFPPEQVTNLYVGPLDYTPAGQSISLVDFDAPDLDRHPRFGEALAHARVAELEPGDALFVPSMWWHHIEALGKFNVLVNYWWRQSPAWMDSPINALMHALMTVRDLPPAQRAAWRSLFEHYVFGANEDTASHIPAEARRVLAPLDADAARELRAHLLQRLNR